MPRPHPRPEPKGQHGESPPEHLCSVWFCCDAGAIQADAFYFFVWRLAEERELDLVKISPNAVPPVCKLMDYGKYRFEQTKREKEARKNQRVVEIKEIRMSPSIDVNDFNVKLRNAQKFLAEGNRCKVTVRFRGREMAHTNIGQELLLKFAESCGEVAVMDKSPKLEGRHMSIFLSPKPVKDAKK